MNSKIQKCTSALLVLVLLLTAVEPVIAANTGDTIAPMSSSYISFYYANISGGNGKITVNFNITGTGKMTSIGATKVQIKNSSGTTVKTFYSTTTDGMLGSNRTSYSSSVTYSGASSNSKYYAVVSFKAADSTGSDTASYTTGYATA